MVTADPGRNETAPSEASSAPALWRRADTRVLAGLLVFLLILFSGVLTGSPERCLGRPEGDARTQFYPWRAFAFQEIREGRFPLWNPYELLGMPFLASLQSALFYPTTWLCAVLPLGLGINLGILINLFLSGAFAYFWARRTGLGWAGASVVMGSYTFGAPQFLRIFEGHWSFLCTMTWIPCLFLCAETLFVRRLRLPAVAGGAVAVAMQLCGGNPQYALYGGVALVLYFLIRLMQERRQSRAELPRLLAGFAGMYALGVVLAGVQFIPALELLGVSSRQGQLSLAWISQYSFVPENLATLLVPNFFGSDVGAEYWGRYNLWEMSAYVGVVTAGLAFLGLLMPRRGKTWPAAALAALMLLLALGRHTPLQAFLYYSTPGFDLFRTWARFLCLFALFVGLLGGLGLEALLAEGSAARRLRWGTHGLAATAAVLLVAGVVLASDAENVRQSWFTFMDRVIRFGTAERLYLSVKRVTTDFASAAQRDASWTLLRSGLLLGGLSVLGGMALRSHARRGTAALLLVVLLAADLGSFCRPYLLTFDPADHGFSEGLTAFLKERPISRYARGGDFRTPPAEGMRHGLASIEGIQPNVPARFRDLFWTFQGRARDTQATYYNLYTLSPPFAMLNLRYLVRHVDFPPRPVRGMKAGVYSDARFCADELSGALPRARLVHRYEVIPDDGAILARLQTLDARRTVILESDPGAPMSVPSDEDPTPQILEYVSTRVTIRTTSSRDGMLVLSDLHFPGWEAEVDGAPTLIHRANYCLRAVAVPAGEHTVRFIYRPRSFRVGILVSLAGCVLLLALVGLHVAQTRKKS